MLLGSQLRPAAAPRHCSESLGSWAQDTKAPCVLKASVSPPSELWPSQTNQGSGLCVSEHTVLSSSGAPELSEVLAFVGRLTSNPRSGTRAPGLL